MNSLANFPSLELGLNNIITLPIESTNVDFVFFAISSQRSLVNSTSEFCSIFILINSLFFTAFAMFSANAWSTPSLPILTTGSILCANFFKKALSY